MSANCRIFLVSAWLVCLVALAGCGKSGNHAAVHGDVNLNGQPLAKGSILFIPLQGTKGVATGADIKDGRYEITEAKGPAVGRNRVEIQALRGTGKMFHDPMLPPDQTAEVFVSAVAARFNSASTLEVEVKPGDNQADFAVQSE